MRQIIIKVKPQEDGIKLSAVLRSFGMSGALLTKLRLTDGSVTRNGEFIRMIDRVNDGDIITVNMEKSGTSPTPWNRDIDILYEDEDLIAVNKPPFMAVHETRNHQGDALSNAVANHIENMGAFRPVYRLDRDTGGIVLVAKNEFAAAYLAGKVKKDYYAVVSGEMEKSGTIDAPIGRMGDSIIGRRVKPDGQRAVTHFTTVKSNGEYSLLKLRLETGRTHQIRVHLSHIGHPLIGDSMYGGDTTRINRQALHCKTIYFTHPVTKEQITIDSPLPDDIKGLI